MTRIDSKFQHKNHTKTPEIKRLSRWHNNCKHTQLSFVSFSQK